MEKQQAKILIDETFNESFDKDRYAKFIINLLDGINTDGSAQFTCGNAYVPEAFRTYINSYGRLGKYTDPNNQNIEVLWVNLKKETALDKARTMQRNFIAWYLNGGRGGKQRKNALVAFYNSELEDWRFSFVKAGTELEQTEKGNIKVKNKFSAAKRFSFLVGEQEPNHTAQKRLFEVLKKDSPTLADIEEAFNIEKVSKEFFAIYKALFLELVDDLKAIREKDSRINHEFVLKSIKESDFCKKLMGQLVFLYFIQKKGWLGVERGCDWGSGDKKFLRTTFEKAQKEGRNFFNDYLEPLFYNALANGERDEDWFDALKCRIPFLNGGLFEPIKEYNWVDTDIVIPNEVFSNNIKTKEDDIGTGILDVFDRYNFTVKEDEPLEKEVAVDPEMLGKVFEELLEVEDRKSKGAFYTPREIVHYMCQESLINYLATELEAKVPKEDIAEFIHHGDEAIQGEAIAKAKEKQGVENSKYEYILPQSIRDFAQDIDNALANVKICDPAIGSGAFPVGMMNEIIRARITLLEAEYIKKTKKTNPYEYKRQAIQNSIYGVDIDSGAIEIAKLRLWLSLVVDEDDMNDIKPLPNLDYKIVCGNSLLSVEKNLFNQKLFEQLEELKPQYFNCTQKREKKRLKKEIDAIITELTRDGSFDFEIYFSEVFHEKQGFDIVIGNPPYVDSEEMVRSQPEIRDLLKLKYKSAKGNWDLFIIFSELALNISHERAVNSYILPNKILAAKYSEDLRKILQNKSFIEIRDYSRINVFKEASVYPIVYILYNSSKYKLAVNMVKIDSCFKVEYQNQIPADVFYKDILWDKFFKDKTTIEILLKASRFKTLKEHGACVTGAATVNEAYEVKKYLVNQFEYNSNEFKKFINSGTIDKYCSLWGKKPMQYIKEKYLYPIIKNEDIASINKNRLTQASSPKIIIANMTKELEALYDEGEFLAAKSTTIIIDSKEKLKYYTAILNSKITSFWYQVNYNSLKMSGEALNFGTNEIENIPIPDTDNQSFFVNKVNKILNAINSIDYQENNDFKTTIEKYINEIDLLVYKAYKLNYSEVLVIDSAFYMDEESYNNYSFDTIQV